MKLLNSIFIILALCVLAANAQNFNYKAQKKLIPSELGKVYIGMPLKDFAKQIDLKNAEADSRFQELMVILPFEKGNLKGISFKVYGLSDEEKKAVVYKETVTKTDDFGDRYETEVEKLRVEKIPAKPFVYEISMSFKSDFDLKNYVLKTYGEPSDTDGKTKDYYIYDMQWFKKTSDGLNWIIRYSDFVYEQQPRKSLQLIGRIDGTEWGLDNL